MSANADSETPARPQVGLPVLIAAGVLVAAGVGFFGYQILTPKMYVPPLPASAAPADSSASTFKTWAQQKYRETGGDWSKLPVPDQQRFTAAARGKGKSMFESYKP